MMKSRLVVLWTDSIPVQIPTSIGKATLIFPTSQKSGVRERKLANFSDYHELGYSATNGWTQNIEMLIKPKGK